MEVKVGDWIVVKFKGQNNKLFLEHLYKVHNSRMFVNFVREKATKRHSGHIFQYPVVKDSSKIAFSQIFKVVPAPENYGRGLLKFLQKAREIFSL